MGGRHHLWRFSAAASRLHLQMLNISAKKSNPKLDCAYFFLLFYWKVEITLRMKEQLNAIVMVTMFPFTDQVRGVLWSGAVAAPDRDAS